MKIQKTVREKLLNCTKIYKINLINKIRKKFQNWNFLSKLNITQKNMKLLNNIEFLISGINLDNISIKQQKEIIIKSLHSKLNQYIINNNIYENVPDEKNKIFFEIKNNYEKINKIDHDQKKFISFIPYIGLLDQFMIPANSSKSEIIENSNISSNPKIIKIPEIPNIPNISSIPKVPGVPSVPKLPGVPEVPSIPGVPGVPTIPGLPGVRGVPTIPGVPRVPGILRIGGPSIPVIPEISSIPTAANAKKENKPPKHLQPKYYFWTQVAKNKIKDSFWVKTDLNLINLEGDYENLCKFFCEPKITEKKVEKKEDNKQVNSGVAVKILDDKRLMNLAIGLSKVQIPNYELREYINRLNYSKLNVELVDKIIALSPNQEESDKLKSFNGDIKLISSSERFCMMLITIPKFLNKLEMIKYKLILDPEIFECRRKYDFLIEAAIIIRVIYS